MKFEIKNGAIDSPMIRQKFYANLEHGLLKNASGIVLHQTNSATEFPTLLAYTWRSVGAHFMISPEGVIYQTAHVNRICHHVGRIGSMCLANNRCTEDYRKAANQLNKANLPDEEKKAILYHWEMQKHVTARYPSNQDSIGIEVVGATKNNIYLPPTPAQNIVSRWLVTQLLTAFSIQRNRVFAHGLIGSDKKPTEAMQVQY